mgnify:CR=1 FL=1
MGKGTAKIEVKMDSRFATAVILVVIGVLLIQLKAGAINAILSVVGALLILRALLCVIDKQWLYAVLFAAIGIFLIVGGITIVDIMVLILGIILSAFGLYQLIVAVKDKKNAGIVSALVTLAVGVLLILFFCFQSFHQEWFYITTGIVAIVAGVLALFGKKLGSN